MRPITTMLAMAALAVCVTAGSDRESRNWFDPSSSFESKAQQSVSGPLRANSLCAKTEHIIFSCRTRSSTKRPSRSPGKIVSLCASAGLDRERGYLQYRYGLPGKIELEFPQSRSGTQQMFQYTHYMRFQVDLTEINFQIDGYAYQIFDDYNGEEKPAISTEGVSVTAPGKEKEVSFTCVTRAKADYSTLQDVLPGVE